MTTPREIIAEAFQQFRDEGQPINDVVLSVADDAIEALTAAGIHLMTDADLAARDDAVSADLETAKRLLANSLREFSPISAQSHRREVIAFLADNP